MQPRAIRSASLAGSLSMGYDPKGDTTTLRALVMPSLVKALGIDRLPAEDQWQLAEELWDKFDADDEGWPLTEAQKLELDRRVAELDAHPERVVSWEEVRARTIARLQK